jgi:hypothetical protein
MLVALVAFHFLVSILSEETECCPVPLRQRALFSFIQEFFISLEDSRLPLHTFTGVGQELDGERWNLVAAAEVKGAEGGEPLGESVNRSASDLVAPGHVEVSKGRAAFGQPLQRVILQSLAPRQVERGQLRVNYPGTCSGWCSAQGQSLEIFEPTDCCFDSCLSEAGAVAVGEIQRPQLTTTQRYRRQSSIGEALGVPDSTHQQEPDEKKMGRGDDTEGRE